MRRPIEVSVVVPVYGCADCLGALHERLTQSVREATPDYEIVFVDDRSPDGAWEVLEELASSDSALRVVRLSRNFGQHAAITAGVAHSTGRWVVVMDCDLQDPPEEIPRLHAKAKEGYDIVFTRRRGRRGSFFRRQASRLYFRLLNLALKTDMSHEVGNFSIVSRRVADAFLRVNDIDRHYLMILRWLGFEHATIEFEHADRYRGKSAYTLAALIRFAFDGLFFQTTTLLRWIVNAGFGISILGVLLAGLFVVNYFVRTGYPGWTSLGVLLLLLSGFIIVSTGVTGLYIGKIFTQVKGRPLYVVDTEIRDGVQPAASDAEPLEASDFAVRSK